MFTLIAERYEHNAQGIISNVVFSERGRYSPALWRQPLARNASGHGVISDLLGLSPEKLFPRTGHRRQSFSRLIQSSAPTPSTLSNRSAVAG